MWVQKEHVARVPDLEWIDSDGAPQTGMTVFFQIAILALF